MHSPLCNRFLLENSDDNRKLFILSPFLCLWQAAHLNGTTRSITKRRTTKRGATKILASRVCRIGPVAYLPI